MSPVEHDKAVGFQLKETTKVEVGEDTPVMSDRANAEGPGGPGPPEEEEDTDKVPFLQMRMNRFSTVSAAGLPTISSRPSFGGLSSRPSMASLRSTISRVNSELYPERGSFVAYSLGQSVADLPALARKMYIVTQILAAISVSVGSMAVGFSAGYTSPALSSLERENSTLTLNEDQKSWVGSLMPLSALTGSIIGGYLIDALGRKKVILLCGPPFIIAWLLIGSASNVWMLYVGRSLGGLCVGLLTLTLPVYLGETIQPEIRGILGLLPTTFGNGGILICYLVGSYVSWWWLAYVGALIPIIFALMMCFVPETPRWYISRDRVEEARLSLQWLRGSYSDVEFELEAIQENYQIATQESSSFRDIFNRRHIRPFLLSMGLMLFQQLSGINAVIFYTVSIFEMSGSSISEHLSTIIVGVVNLLSTFVANALIDKLGRKILLYISCGMMVISLVALGVFFHLKALTTNGVNIDETQESWSETIANLSWIPLVSFMVYVVAFSLGWGPIPWLFMGEALPARIRGPAASAVTALNWSCTFIITKTFPGMVKALGASNVFFMFTGIMVLGSIYSVFLVPETRGKSLEEIEAELAGRKESRRDRKISTVSGLHM